MHTPTFVRVAWPIHVGCGSHHIHATTVQSVPLVSADENTCKPLGDKHPPCIWPLPAKCTILGDAYGLAIDNACRPAHCNEGSHWFGIVSAFNKVLTDQRNSIQDPGLGRFVDTTVRSLCHAFASRKVCAATPTWYSGPHRVNENNKDSIPSSWVSWTTW
jgi:hypothetical protein